MFCGGRGSERGYYGRPMTLMVRGGLIETFFFAPDVKSTTGGKQQQDAAVVPGG